MSGKEVISIIRDPTDAAVKMVRVQAYQEKIAIVRKSWRKNVLDVLIPPAKNNPGPCRTAAGAFCRPSNVPQKKLR